MDYEHLDDGGMGIYVNPITGKVILQLHQVIPLHFRDLDELEGLLKYLSSLVLDTRANIGSTSPVVESDKYEAVEEFERIIVESIPEASGSFSEQDNGDHRHRGVIFDSNTTSAMSSPGAGHDLVDSYWKVTLMGMTGRHKTKLVNGIRGLNDLNYEYRKRLVESCPSAVTVTRTRVEANMIKVGLESIGGVADVSLGMGQREQDDTPFLWELNVLDVREGQKIRVASAMTVIIGQNVAWWSRFIDGLPDKVPLRAPMKDIARLKETLSEAGAVTRIYPAREYPVQDGDQSTLF